MCSSAKVMTDRRHSRRKSMARAKLWTQVNKGVARLQPLLGEFKPVNGMMKTVTNTAPPSNRARTSSVKYPCLNKSLRTMSFEAAYGEGPADINFLKNKLGFCIPSEELILRSQTLRLTSEWHPPRSSLDDLTSSSALKNITSLTNRKSFLDSVKSDQRRASFRMDSQKLGHHMSLDENLREVERLEHILNIKVSPSSALYPITDVQHTENRMAELKKIAERARRNSQVHEMMIEQKLSTYRDKDEKIYIDVKSHIDLSKIDDRTKIFNKISRLESKIKSFAVRGEATIHSPTNEEENEEIYRILQHHIVTSSESTEVT
ncbi:uncharacterized protein LOC106078027 [Biomphalaria glabrata]|uniref:Uncharacterized protein LOC106078027 n=1 Tax=Biomphalaria glabrata TaxID=6526 RepID=A0A2C9LFT5_BIOGL|nr:uncharacterized protein LOC106078027 [Biomphalaria glabrata]XP_055889644.1 uncharacterized protein LOC106078027 [Biomphalaria glabrata]